MVAMNSLTLTNNSKLINKQTVASQYITELNSIYTVALF